MNLEKKERRSSLKYTDSAGKKRYGGHVDQAKPKRRISFCGRKSVREFHAEEKPKSWNNSYEISDHLNISENTLCFKSDSGCENRSTDCKENAITVESISNVPEGFHQMVNASKIALRENIAEISNILKDVPNAIQESGLGNGDKTDVIGSEKKIMTKDYTFYGNEDIFTDHQNRLSVMQAMEMDISNVHRNESHRRNKLINCSNDDEIEATMTTYGPIESVNNAGRRLSINIEESMDISMQMNEHIDSITKNNCHSNSKGELQINANTELVTPKVCSLSENLLADTISKIGSNQTLCGNILVESGSDGQYSNNSSLLNMENKLDIKNYGNTSSLSYNSPLFPQFKSKKLNLRQLNAEICDGKIVVFPNKIKQCLLASPNINITPKTQFKEENNINEILDGMNYKKDVSRCLEYADMTSDNTSFLVREKVGDETVLINALKQPANEYKKNTTKFDAEIDTPHTKMVLSASLKKNICLQSINRDFHNSLQNIKGFKPSIYVCNAKESNALPKDFTSSVYDILDMSLNLTNIQSINTLPKSVKSEATETCENKHDTKLDVTPQTNKNLHKQRHTVYFNQDIASLKSDIHSLSGLDSNILGLKSSHDINLPKGNDNTELKCTPLSKVAKYNKAVVMREKAFDFSDDFSDSLVLNLKEARAALSYNCKRRIEGTPHRSFLEFVHLEREVAKDDEISFDEGIQVEFNPISQEGQVLEAFKEHEQQSQRKNMESTYESSNINLSGLNLKETDNLHSSSPITDTFLYKRSTANLTPNLPFPKKRQTLLFKDCPMDETINSFVPKNIRSGNTNEEIHKNCTVPELLDKEGCAQNQYATKTDDPIKNMTSVEDIEEKDNITQTQLIIKDSKLFESQNKNKSPSVNTYQSNISITYNFDAKERESISVQSTGLSKGGDSTMMEISLDTIQIPRRATTKLENRDSDVKLPSASQTLDDLVIKNENFKNIENEFDDNPITISDVSVHYLEKRKTSIINRHEDDVKNEFLIDSNEAAVFNKQFINLERENSSLCIPETDDIDKTRLSLVETFISEYAGNDEVNVLSANQSIEELVNISKTRFNLVETFISENAGNDRENQLTAKKSINELLVGHNCDTNRHITLETCPLLLKEINTKLDMVTNKNHITLCRRCKDSQELFDSGSTSIISESFALPCMPLSPSLGMERLDNLRKLPKLKDVHEYWQRRSLEKNDSNLLSFDPENEKTLDSCKEILNLDNYAFKKIENQLCELQFKALQTDIFFKSLNKMISKTLPNWVLNCQTRARKIITFVHKRFVSFSLEMVYSDYGQLGNNITIQDVYLRRGRVLSKYWKPIDHILDFNLKINLPVDLKLLLHSGNNEEPILKLLQHMDKVCDNVLEDARSLWRLVCKEEASLIRDSNRVVVRKFTREIEEVTDIYPFVKKTEFQIEVNNIRTLSVNDIIYPPLFRFSEELKLLPSGIYFLKDFLKSPCRYLKQ